MLKFLSILMFIFISLTASLIDAKVRIPPPNDSPTQKIQRQCAKNLKEESLSKIRFSDISIFFDNNDLIIKFKITNTMDEEITDLEYIIATYDAEDNIGMRYGFYEHDKTLLPHKSYWREVEIEGKYPFMSVISTTTKNNKMKQKRIEEYLHNWQLF